MDHQQINAFWAEMSACEHFVQFYEQDEIFVDTLTGFISGGLADGHAAVVIATPAHRQELNRRLTAMGLDIVTAQAQDRLITLDAEETLAKFMVDGHPDEKLFHIVITDILARATKGGRKVRAFGEMVALMWAQGQREATVRLEYLWHDLCQKKSFALFCAYPKIGFDLDCSESISHLCAAHSKVLDTLWPSAPSPHDPIEVKGRF